MITDLSFQPGSIVASIGHLIKDGVGYANSSIQTIPIDLGRPGHFVNIRSTNNSQKIKCRIVISTEPYGSLHFVGVKEMPQRFYRPSLVDPIILMRIPSAFSDIDQENAYVYKAAFNLITLITTGALHRIVFDNHRR